MRAQFLSWVIGLIAMLAVNGTVRAGNIDEAVPRSPLGESIPAYEATSIPGPFSEPAGELRLRDALALALLHNPRLATFSWEARATEAAMVQAGARPNPEAGFEYENFAGGGDFSGTGNAEATLTLSQLVELGGKRGKRVELARLKNRVASWDYETTRIQTYAATASSFARVLAAQEQLALAEKIVELTDEIQGAVSRRARAGGSLPLEENRAKVAAETSRIERDLARRHLSTMRGELALLWGSTSPAFERAAGNLETLGDHAPPMDDLFSKLDQNPAVERWTTELDRRRTRMDLINAHRVPDMNIDLGFRRHNATGDMGLVLGLSAPLPLWDRKQGASREAEYLSEKAGQERRMVKTTIRSNIAVAYEEMTGAHEEIIRLRDHALPLAEEAALESADFYSSGAMPLTDVLDVQRTFYQLRVRYVNALSRYHGAVAKIEGLVGEPLKTLSPDLESPNQKEGE